MWVADGLPAAPDLLLCFYAFSLFLAAVALVFARVWAAGGGHPANRAHAVSELAVFALLGVNVAASAVFFSLPDAVEGRSDDVVFRPFDVSSLLMFTAGFLFIAAPAVRAN